MTIATDFRAEVKRILERYTGKPFDAISPISVSAVRAIDDRLDDLEDRAARCTCGAAHDALLFEIDHSRADARPYEIMAQEAVQRMQERGVL